VSAAAFFDAFRALKREETGDASAIVLQAEVDAVNAIRATWKRTEEPGNPTALTDAAKFFASVRSSFGSLTQLQVQGSRRCCKPSASRSGRSAGPLTVSPLPGTKQRDDGAGAARPYLGNKAEAWRKTPSLLSRLWSRLCELTWRGDDRIPHYGCKSR
jgi:hypothetical protein